PATRTDTAPSISFATICAPISTANRFKTSSTGKEGIEPSAHHSPIAINDMMQGQNQCLMRLFNRSVQKRIAADQCRRDRRAPEPGMALCLSGGGYRAMVFHIGALWRLYEARLLGSVKRISSVSGGSITAAL